MEIIDNFLDKTEFEHIQKIMMGSDFPWYFSPHISTPSDDKKLYYFEHSFFRFARPTQYFELWKGLLNKLKYKALIRAKANLFLSAPTVQHHHFHNDYNYNHKTCLLYINTNNGPTTIGKKQIFPKANRAVLFNGSLKHCSSSCSDEQIRVTANFNYF